MKHELISVSPYQPLLAAFAALALCALFVFPIKASALQISTQTAQILPPGPNQCAPIQVSNVTPFIYKGTLDSFEFTVSDPSYVAVVGSVGQTSIPLRYMTRLPDASGGVRYHVDIDSTSVYGSLPVTITLLSARTGAPVCASVLSFDAGTGQSVTSGSSGASHAPVQQSSYSTPHKQATSSTYMPASTTVGTQKGSTTASMGGITTAGAPSMLKNICSSDASAYRLWLVLLIVYALVVGALLWLEFPMSWRLARTPERVASIILILLVLLLGFWYIAISCRAALWMPLVAFLLAVLGLLAAFWNHPKVAQLLLIQEKSTAIITPPPQQKK